MIDVFSLPRPQATQTSYPSWAYMWTQTVETPAVRERRNSGRGLEGTLEAHVFRFLSFTKPSQTTLWELWNAPTGSPTMDSRFVAPPCAQLSLFLDIALTPLANNNDNRNHIMFGSVGDWLYQSLAGIRQPESSTGYRQIVFQPPPSNVLLFSGTPPPVRRRAQAIERRSGAACRPPRGERLA